MASFRIFYPSDWLVLGDVREKELFFSSLYVKVFISGSVLNCCLGKKGLQLVGGMNLEVTHLHMILIFGNFFFGGDKPYCNFCVAFQFTYFAASHPFRSIDLFWKF